MNPCLYFRPRVTSIYKRVRQFFMPNYLSKRELRAMLADSEKLNLALEVGMVEMEAECHESTVRQCAAAQLELNHTRAQLMQLRVENSDPKSLGRVGWQVSAFIPEAVLKQLRAGTAARLEAFTGTVARDLVAGALRGIFKRNAAGHCTALVWEPLSAYSKKSVLTGWFEGDPKKPGVIYNSNDDAAIRRITGRADADAALKKLLDAGKP